MINNNPTFKVLKIIAFIILAVLFIVPFYIWGFTDKIQDIRLVGVTGFPIRIYVLMPILIVGLVNLIILLKSTRLYTIVFFGLVAITFVFHCCITLWETNQENEAFINKYENHDNSKILESAWKIIDNPREALGKLETIESSTDFIIGEKIAIYFALSIENKTYDVYFQHQMKEINSYGCGVVYYLLKNYDLETVENYTRFFELLDKYNIRFNIDSCDNYYPKEVFAFDKLLALDHEVARLSLERRILTLRNTKTFLENAQTIENSVYREKIISEILIKAYLFNDIPGRLYGLSSLVDIILQLKEEPSFYNYLTILQKKLEEKKQQFEINFETNEPSLNQENQIAFMEMVGLLRGKHSIVKSFPAKLSKFYWEQEEFKNRAKTSIVYRAFLSQVYQDIHHKYPIKHELYNLFINDTLVNKGHTNEYGCISYIAYDGKPTDRVKIVIYTSQEMEQPLGWEQLLLPWDSPKGMMERLQTMGYSYCQENDSATIEQFQQEFNLEPTGTYSKETAFKVRSVYEECWDKKWWVK